jgi:hypothetical protein
MIRKVEKGSWCSAYKEISISLPLTNLEQKMELFARLNAIPDIHQHVLLLPPAAYVIKFMEIKNINEMNGYQSFEQWEMCVHRDLGILQDALVNAASAKKNASFKVRHVGFSGLKLLFLWKLRLLFPLAFYETMNDTFPGLKFKFRMRLACWKKKKHARTKKLIRDAVRDWSASKTGVLVGLPRLYTCNGLDCLQLLEPLSQVKKKKLDSL